MANEQEEKKTALDWAREDALITREAFEKQKKEAAREPSYTQTLVLSGWDKFYIAARIEDLENPDKEYGTFGLFNANGDRQVFVTAPASKWLDELTRFAKKQAKKI